MDWWAENVGNCPAARGGNSYLLLGCRKDVLVCPPRTLLLMPDSRQPLDHHNCNPQLRVNCQAGDPQGLECAYEDRCIACLTQMPVDQKRGRQGNEAGKRNQKNCIRASPGPIARAQQKDECGCADESENDGTADPAPEPRARAELWLLCFRRFGIEKHSSPEMMLAGRESRGPETTAQIQRTLEPGFRAVHAASESI